MCYGYIIPDAFIGNQKYFEVKKTIVQNKRLVHNFEKLLKT